MAITGINGAINYTMGYANNAVKKNTAKSSARGISTTSFPNDRITALSTDFQYMESLVKTLAKLLNPTQVSLNPLESYMAYRRI